MENKPYVRFKYNATFKRSPLVLVVLETPTQGSHALIYGRSAASGSHMIQTLTQTATMDGSLKIPEPMLRKWSGNFSQCRIIWFRKITF